jgi:uncharacterized iron-regulated membrane protein
MTFVELLETWVPLTVGILTIITIVAGMIYSIHKKFITFIHEEIKEVAKEFKPNGGSSLKDQVNRLENQHGSLSKKVDEIYDLLTTPTKPVRTTKPKN